MHVSQVVLFKDDFRLRWNIFLDDLLAAGVSMRAGGFSRAVAKQHLSQGGSSHMVVPLIIASLGPQLTGGALGSAGSTPLRDVIELDCRGKLACGHNGQFILEFSEIKSSLEGAVENNILRILSDRLSCC